MLDDDPSHIFPVEISRTKNVGHLKNTIKEKKKPLFDYVPADALVLWQVSLPVDDDFDKQLERLNLTNERSLLPVKKLGTLFSDEMIEENVHIIVKRPPPSEFICLSLRLICRSI